MTTGTTEVIMDSPRHTEIPLVDGPKGLQLTDTGNASVFAQHHGQDVRYSHKNRKWYFWTGSQWAEDEQGEIQRRAKATAQSLFAFGADLQDSDRRDKFVRHALASQSDHRIRAMINLAVSEPGISVSVSDFDSDPWLLNVINGTLELKTGNLKPHRRDDLITRMVPVVYNPEALCPRWDQFLEEVMAGDRVMVRYLQKVIGYSLTGSTHEQVFFILCGPGANGKSTFINMIHRLLDTYAKKTPTETLLIKPGKGNPNNDIARLNGARFVSADEAEHGRRLGEALIKQLTGGDKISARFLYGEFFDFDPTFKIFLDVNHKPIIRGADHAIWRRVHLIPFNVTFPPEKRDKNLVTRLEAELPGILRWAVEGCLVWQAEGLEAPQDIEAATADYRSEMDVVGDFIAERCELDASAKTPFGELFDTYAAWAQKNGHDDPERKEFATALADKGFQDGRNGTLGRYRRGLRLKP